jgi:hypothetical protein
MQNVDEKQKTDEEIHDLAMDEWLGQLVRLWDAVGKPLEADRLAIYQRELADIPLGLLELAISRVIRENTYNNVPAVGIIWKAVRKELGDPHDVMDAISEWCERLWQRCLMLHVDVAVETE